MLPIIFIVPVFQLIVLVYAATLDMKNIKMVIVDKDMSSTSRQLTAKFKGSPFYQINNNNFSIKKAELCLIKDEADIILHIPYGFEKNLSREQQSELQLLINAINGTAANLINVYTSGIIMDYNKDILMKWFPVKKEDLSEAITVTPTYWYNTELNYKYYMLPGILVILVTIIGSFLTALNIVREKEMGTVEQINVTPIKKHQFLAGKMIPFGIIALVELAFGLVLGKILFGLPIVGSIPLLFAATTIYLLVILGIGLFFAALAQTQQQVMFYAYFFMLTFILMSGIFTPIESMPYWAQKINIINPFMYFMKTIRMIMLKGSGIMDILPEMISLFCYAIIINGMAIWQYKKIH